MGPVRSDVISRSLRSAYLAAVVTFTAAAAQGVGAQDSAIRTVFPDAPSFLQSANQAAPARVACSISGKVSDVAGGIVPGATIAILGNDGKPQQSVTSDSAGHFSIDGMQPGTYKLLITAEGLKSFQPPAIVLKPGEQYVLPETAMPIATANQSVDVVLTQEMIADQELHDQTKQRVLGVLPNFFTSYQWNAAPMNAKQKFKLTFRAEIDPVSFAIPALVAAIEEDRNRFPDYGNGAAGFGRYYGAAYGDAFIGRTIGQAILPSIFRQDARYFYMGAPSTFGQRLRHAIAFSVTARSDRGHDGHLMPNYSHILGNFVAGYISKTYHPDSNRGLGLAVDNALIGIGGSAVQGILREFVLRRVSTNTTPYVHGKVRELPAAQPGPASSPASTSVSSSTTAPSPSKP